MNHIRATPAAERAIEVCPLGRRGRYGLTPKQQRLYLAIVRHFDRTGRIPTIRCLVKETGLWTVTVTLGLSELEVRGWIRKTNGRNSRMQPRGIELLEPVLRHLKPAGLSPSCTGMGGS